MTSLARQPCFGGGYGRLKLGKTTDAVMSFPNAWFVAAPGALKPSLGVAGFEPKMIRDLGSMPEIIDYLKAAAKAGADSVVVDDFSLFVQRQVQLFTAAGLSGFGLWGAIFRASLLTREEARRCGVHVWFTMHEIEPRVVDGKRRPGSVALPGDKLPYDVPSAFDLLLRAQSMPEGMGNIVGWPVVYRCSPSDPDWSTGDRHNVTPDMAPMNVGEILRLYERENKVPGFAPKRLFPWQEALVERGAKVLLDQNVFAEERDLESRGKAILKEFAELVRRKSGATDDRHVLWTVRDAWDRAVLTHALVSHRTRLYY